MQDHVQDIVSHVISISELNKLCGVSSAKCIYKCKSKRCQMKNIFSALLRVVSTASKINITSSDTVHLDYHSTNVVYLINSSRGSLQYFREIGQKINKRFKFHKSCFI